MHTYLHTERIIHESYELRPGQVIAIETTISVRCPVLIEADILGPHKGISDEQLLQINRAIRQAIEEID